MHKRFTITLIPFICTFFLTSCSDAPESALRPLISLQWFDTYEDADEEALYNCSCFIEGGRILNMSNPGDYPLDESDQDIDYEIIEIK